MPHILTKRYHLIIFYFLFHGLHFVTTVRVLMPVLCFQMISFNYGAKEVRDLDPVCRCHQSNSMPDSIFSVNIAQRVTCGYICFYVFCIFLLFYVCVKGWYSGLLLFIETGCSVFSLINEWTWRKLKLQRSKTDNINWL